MHRRRWLTALVVLPLLLLVLLKGGRLGLVLVILAVSALAQWEFLGMFRPEAPKFQRLKSILLGSLLLLSFCTAYPYSDTICYPGGLLPCTPTAVLFILFWCTFFLFLFYLLSYGHIEQLAQDLAVNVLGLIYLPFLLGHFIWLRYLPQGEMWVLWLLIVIFAGDTGAFYVGQALGKSKLYPAVSPGKTWAGAVGGVILALVAGLLAGKWLLPEVNLRPLGVLALVLALVGLLGDLFESMLKRQTQVKDASQLLPGHGGMLDRLDSLLFAAPAVLYARLFILGG
ncbi:MAG: phosphatidate cytidylyltransferase [Deltaproteobacteria bacterium]|nr:phosphatidate cytidylyltransferase [Deltaproteobacteria bacterium]MBI4795506.1 phosphatidate cytidylyltransferase [Deltaproteobacteria bacterium]